MTELRMVAKRTGDVVTLQLDGELDLSNIVHVGDEMAELVDIDAVGVALDLSAVRYIDSAGVRMLFELGRTLAASRQTLMLVLPEDSPVRTLVSVTGLDAVAPVAARVEDAVGRLSNGLPKRL